MAIVCIVQCGDNSLVKDLPFHTCWEHHHKARFYTFHPVIDNIFEMNNTVFKSKSEIFSTLLSNKTFDNIDKNDLEMYVSLEAQNSQAPGPGYHFYVFLL